MRVDMTLVRADGGRHDVALLADAWVPGADVVRALKRALRADPQTACHVDADACPDEPQDWTELFRHGSIVQSGTSVRSPGSTVRLIVSSGPDCGAMFELSRSRVLIGRDPECDVVLTDPDVSRHHAALDNGGATASVRDLMSTNGTRLNGELISGRQVLRPADVLCAGNTVLRLETTHTSGSDSDTPRDDQPTAAIDWPAPPELDRTAPVPIAASLGSVAAAAGIGVMTHSLPFLLLSLITPVVLMAGWLSAWLRRRVRLKRRRTEHAQAVHRAERALAAGLAAEAVVRRSAHPDPVALASRLAHYRTAAAPRPVPDVHARDRFLIRIGLGDQRARLSVVRAGISASGGTVPMVPVLYSLGPAVTRIGGNPDGVVRLARWLVVQLCASAADDLELALVVGAERDADWSWTRWLPQLRCSPPTRTVQTMPPPRGRRLVVVDLGEYVSDALLMRCFTGSIVVVVDTDTQPGGLSLHVRPGGPVHAVVTDEHGAHELSASADGISTEQAESIARALAAQPMAHPGGSINPPTSLLALLRGATEGLPHRWPSNDGAARAVVGAEHGAPFDVDLCRDGPHALVVGTTGSGKSELLQTWVASLALSYPPDEFAFVLIDYKGGAAFGRCAALPHVTSVVTDLDREDATRALRSLHAELRRREALLAEARATTFDEYRASAGRQRMPRLVIMVDEFAAMAREQPAFMDGLVSVAQRGRSLGLHLVLATQRAGSAVSSDIRANTALRIALRVADPGESQDVVGTADAARIPAGDKGAAVVLRSGTVHTVRVARVTGAAAAPEPVRLLPLDRWRRIRAGHAVPDDPRRACAQEGSAQERSVQEAWVQHESAQDERQHESAQDERQHDERHHDERQHDQRPRPTELDEIVRAVRTAALESGRRGHPAPWLPPLPHPLPVHDIDAAAAPHVVSFGLVDLPDEQRQVAASIDLFAGDAVAFLGTARSGRTTALRTIAHSAAHRLSPSELVMYAIDAAGGALCATVAGLPHTATAASVDDLDQVARLVTRLRDEIRRRQGSAAAHAARGTDRRRPQGEAILVLLDGREAFLQHMDRFDHGRTSQCFGELLAHGPAVGVSVALTGGPADSARPGTVGCSYNLGASVAGLHHATSGGLLALPPGRGVRVLDGAAVQIALPPPHRSADHAAPAGPGRIVIRPLPERVLLDDLTAETAGSGAGPAFVIGVGGDSAEVLALDLLTTSTRMLVAGPPRSGKSTVLLSLLMQASVRAVPVCVLADRRSPLAAAAAAQGLDVVAPDGHLLAVERMGGLVLVDDIGRLVDSPAVAALNDALRAGSNGVAVVASGDATDLSILHRSVIAELRQSRTAVLLQPSSVDGELVGVRLPRTTPTTVPGRGVLVAAADALPHHTGEPLPVQVALPAPRAERRGDGLSPCAGNDGR